MNLTPPNKSMESSCSQRNFHDSFASTASQSKNMVHSVLSNILRPFSDHNHHSEKLSDSDNEDDESSSPADNNSFECDFLADLEATVDAEVAAVRAQLSEDIKQEAGRKEVRHRRREHKQNHHHENEQQGHGRRTPRSERRKLRSLNPVPTEISVDLEGTTAAAADEPEKHDGPRRRGEERGTSKSRPEQRRTRSASRPRNGSFSGNRQVQRSNSLSRRERPRSKPRRQASMSHSSSHHSHHAHQQQQKETEQQEQEQRQQRARSCPPVKRANSCPPTKRSGSSKPRTSDHDVKHSTTATTIKKTTTSSKEQHRQRHQSSTGRASRASSPPAKTTANKEKDVWELHAPKRSKSMEVSQKEKDSVPSLSSPTRSPKRSASAFVSRRKNKPSCSNEDQGEHVVVDELCAPQLPPPVPTLCDLAAEVDRPVAGSDDEDENDHHHNLDGPNVSIVPAQQGGANEYIQLDLPQLISAA